LSNGKPSRRAGGSGSPSSSSSKRGSEKKRASTTMVHVYNDVLFLKPHGGIFSEVILPAWMLSVIYMIFFQ